MPARREVGSFSGCGSRGGRPSLDAGVCDAQDAGIVHTGKEENGHATIRSDTGDGTSVENPTGGVTTFKAVGDQSDGALTVIEGVSAPGEGPPLHVHREQDEFIYTLDGVFRVRLGDDLIEALPGRSSSSRATRRTPGRTSARSSRASSPPFSRRAPNSRSSSTATAPRRDP